MADKPANAAGSGRAIPGNNASGGTRAPGTVRATISASRAREVIEIETARILGPMGITLVHHVWAHQRPRGLESLMAVLWEISEEMDDVEQAERYVQHTVQRIMDAARER